MLRLSYTHFAVLIFKLSYFNVDQVLNPHYLRRHWIRSGVFIVNFKQILVIVLVLPLLTLHK